MRICLQNTEWRLPAGRPAAIGERVSRALWGKPYYSEKAMDMLAKEKDQQRAGKRFFVCSPAAAVEMKRRAGDCQSADRCNISMGLEAILAHGFAGIESECDRRQSDLCLSVLMEVSKRKTGDRRSNPCGSKRYSALRTGG